MWCYLFKKKSNFTAFNLKLSCDSVQGIFFEYAFSYDFKKVESHWNRLFGYAFSREFEKKVEYHFNFSQRWLSGYAFSCDFLDMPFHI